MNWKKHLVVYILLGLSLVLSVISICFSISSSVIKNETILFGFIGILVTIVVIGNVAHVIVIKDDIDKRIQELEEQNKTNIASLKEVSDLVSALVEKNKTKIKKNG